MLPIELPPSNTNLTRADYLRLAKELAALEPVENTKSVAVLASFTTDFFKPCLMVEAARKNQHLEVWLAPYGQIEQQALDLQSSLHEQKTDMILINPQLDQLAPELSFRFLAHTSLARTIQESTYGSSV